MKSMECNDHENIFGRSGPTLSGAIFMANRETKRECLKLNLFGLPPPQINFVKKVKSGMILFLFEYEERKLYGVFQASSDGACNIVPNAFKSSGKQFPAQIRFKSVWHSKPLSERDFGDAIRDNYFTSKKFNLGLSGDQVSELLQLFNSKRIGTQKSKGPLLRELLSRPLSSFSGRIGVFEDAAFRESASRQSQTRHAIDKPFNLTAYSGLSTSYLNSSSSPDRSILDSNSLMLGRQHGLSSSGHTNHPYSNCQSSINMGEFYTNSSGVGIDMKGSPQGFVAYPSSLADASLPYSGNQGIVSRSGSFDEKSKLGEYIPLEDDPCTSPSFCLGKDPPHVPEYVAMIPVGLRSHIPDRISVFDRLKDGLSTCQADSVFDDYISEEVDGKYEAVLDDYMSLDVDGGYEDALLTTEEVECNDVAVEEPPVNFKRRNKTRPIQDYMTTEESNSLSGNLARKRRKISRPSFVSEGTHEKGISGKNLPNGEELSCQEIIECKEKGTTETSVMINGEESEKFTVQSMVHRGCEGSKGLSENFVVRSMVHTVCSEDSIDKTEFESDKGGSEANEKEPTPVSLVTEISENKDGNNNTNTESPNNRDLKTRVTEFESNKGGGEANEKELTPLSLVTEMSENKDGSSNTNIERPNNQDLKTRVTEFEADKGGSEANEKKPTPVSPVTEISENKDGSSNANIERPNNLNLKTRVTEFESDKGGSEANEKESTPVSLVTEISENKDGSSNANIEGMNNRDLKTRVTEFESDKGGGEANEKEPTPVSLVTEISENKDGSSNANIERSSNLDLKTRVTEFESDIGGSEANEKEPTSVSLVTKISENKDGSSNAKIERLNKRDLKTRVTEFESDKGWSEANEKEPTPVSLVAEIYENKDGSSNANIERSSNRDLKTRVEELVQELKSIQGSSANEQDAIQRTW